MKILSGKLLADKFKNELKKEIQSFAGNFTPTLAVIMAGDNPTIELYVNKKKQVAKELGIKVLVKKFSKDASTEQVLKQIEDFNNDPKVNGILVQLPLPKQMNFQKVIWAIAPEKDVDGFQMRFYRPPAPLAILDIFMHYSIPIYKKKVSLVGYGILVGKPLSVLLKKQGALINVCDISTKNLKNKLSDADIIISAVGKKNLISADMVSKNQIIIDAGTTSEEGATKGDVDFENVSKIVKAITPVPGGIGPLTVIELFSNLVKATKKQNADFHMPKIMEKPIPKIDDEPFIKRVFVDRPYSEP